MSAPLPAGDFSTWLRDMRRALAGTEGMDVACGDCRGCCTSSYFIKIRPHEAGTRLAVGEDCLEPAPNAPAGTMLMGYDENGHCAMFRGGNCSIYQNRPDTCRTYDCRVFAAAGTTPGDGRPVISERVARWRFEYPSDLDREEHRAVSAAANFLARYPVRFPGGGVPSRPSEIAVLAVKAYQVFLHPSASDAENAAAIVSACRAFDQAGA
ncbi:MAG: YkgJ family cysteine cluster protein [Pseudomonadota bacterium]